MNIKRVLKTSKACGERAAQQPNAILYLVIPFLGTDEVKRVRRKIGQVKNGSKKD